MLSIRTDLSSLITQGALSNSTNRLNQAIERMATGSKINCARDNAANYSINTNMATKIGAYNVAEDNVANGLDLLTTASSIIEEMQDRASRLEALSLQTRNGTYGAQSLDAINAEAAALVMEINRLYNGSEYNGVELFNRAVFKIAEHLPQAGESGFIDETSNPTPGNITKAGGEFIVVPDIESTDGVIVHQLKDIDPYAAFDSNEKYSISTPNELVQLSQMVANGADTTGVTFFLTSDIDMKGVSYTSISTFKGTFNGNGHVIKNMAKTMFDTTTDATIKNLGVEGSITNGSGVINNSTGGEIKNCYFKGSVQGQQHIGGLVGKTSSEISYSYTEGSVKTTYRGNVGGLVGVQDGRISNCYSNSNITAAGWLQVGGLIGLSRNTIENCYATGNVDGGTASQVGGLVGYQGQNITNCYASGNVFSSGQYVGGFVGEGGATIKNCYSIGDVEGTALNVGGFAGTAKNVKNCYAKGDVLSSNNRVGGLIGGVEAGSLIESSYATGNVFSTGASIGGLLGTGSGNISNCFSIGLVNGETQVGGLVGWYAGIIENSYSLSDVSGTSCVGGLVGDVAGYRLSSVTYSGCAAYGEVSGTQSVGSFVGSIVNSNDGITFTDVIFNNCQVKNGGTKEAGDNYYFDSTNSTSVLIPDADLSDWEDSISAVFSRPITTTLHVGVKGDSSCQISFDTNFLMDLSALKGGVDSDSALSAIRETVGFLSDKLTELGAAHNRLESALDEIVIQRDNLISSRSTIRDADMAEVSSTYIQQQILQEASATLMASSNNIRMQNVLGLLQGL